MLDTILLWFQTIMRTCTQRLIKMSVGPQAFGEKPYSQEEINASLDEFYQTILPIIDKKLSRTQFLCGEDYTIVDLQFYNEIKTIVSLYKRNMTSREFPNLFDWFNQISRIDEVQETDLLLQTILEKYNLA